MRKNYIIKKYLKIKNIQNIQMSIYEEYINYIKNIVLHEDLENTNFKSNQTYKSILEHVSPQLGYMYIDNILNRLDYKNINNIIQFCNINDKIGNPDKILYKISDLQNNFVELNCSPSSLRYASHALQIIMKLKENKIINKEEEEKPLCILEIGGGYGGLCLALNYFLKLENFTNFTYNIIDLPYIHLLQKKYLNYHNITAQTFTEISDIANIISKTKNNFLIANYSLSELDDYLIFNYMNNLFPHFNYGYMIWNSTFLNTGINLKKIYNFDKFEYNEEYPQTGTVNKEIFFIKN